MIVSVNKYLIGFIFFLSLISIMHIYVFKFGIYDPILLIIIKWITYSSIMLWIDNYLIYVGEKKEVIKANIFIIICLFVYEIPNSVL